MQYLLRIGRHRTHEYLSTYYIVGSETTWQRVTKETYCPQAVTRVEKQFKGDFQILKQH